MKDESIEVTKYNWGPGHLSGPTDTTWLKLLELPNGNLIIIEEYMGPQTEAMYGSHDYEIWIEIEKGSVTQFIAMLLAHMVDETENLSFDQLKEKCSDWGVPFVEGDRALDPWGAGARWKK